MQRDKSNNQFSTVQTLFSRAARAGVKIFLLAVVSSHCDLVKCCKLVFKVTQPILSFILICWCFPWTLTFSDKSLGRDSCFSFSNFHCGFKSMYSSLCIDSSSNFISSINWVVIASRSPFWTVCSDCCSLLNSSITSFLNSISCAIVLLCLPVLECYLLSKKYETQTLGYNRYAVWNLYKVKFIIVS